MPNVEEARDYIVACTIATEIPPNPTGPFTNEMINIARYAVSDVIRNRVLSLKFPNTPVEVVLQKNQFSAVCRETYWNKAMAGKWFPAHVMSCYEAWRSNAPPLAPGALYYYSPVSMNPKFKSPVWVPGLTEVNVVGMHRDYFRFYR